MRNRTSIHAALAAALLAIGEAADAHTVTITVPGPLDSAGSIGCGLYAGPTGFPMDSSVARMSWQPARAGGVTCVFDGVADGRYAVSVLLDLNGNRRVDTNFVGMPKEAWGVSNNARPALRPPRFDEAAFTVADGKPVSLTIEVAK